jgi:peptide/nickel transport system permease protein
MSTLASLPDEPVLADGAGARLSVPLGRRILGSPSALAGAVTIGFIVVVAILSLFWTPYDPTNVAPSDAFQGMSWHHLLGTDDYGRDVASRIMSGAKIILFSGAVSVAIAAAIGVPVGLIAALRGGIIENLLMRACDVLYGFPALLSAIVLAAAIGASTLSAMIAIGVASIPALARVTRSSALPVLSSEFVLAARTYGRRRRVIVLRHVLPNIAPILIIQMSTLFSLAILAEAGLSYLGLGTPPPQPSWGAMVQEGQNFLNRDALLVIWPGVFVALAVLGFNLLGDGLRDVLDPRLRRSR